ncbi:hypothetical protein [Pleomorphomonas oryzae]|uniref:hypothetical protein n=1 Tax=Pleomorphomonas oryzae TaxID=261934 RepID=UPI0012EBF2B5|nr:hypothetical protein [Pleomorphomonas oryzae]
MSRLLVSAVFVAIVGAYIANQNNRNPWLWGAVCFVLPGVGIIILMVIGKAPEPAPLPRKAWEIDLNTTPAPVTVRPERAWWDHLKATDADVKAAADEVSQLSADYEDVLADQFVAPGDKKDYLRSLVEALKAQHAALVEQQAAEDDAAMPSLQAKRKLALEKRVDRSRAMMEEIAANGMICRQTGKKVASMQLYAGRQIDDHGYAYLRYEDGTSELRSGDYFTLAPSDGP